MDHPPPIPSQQPPPLPPGAFVGHSPNIPFDPSAAPAPNPRRTPIWLWIVTLSLLAVLVVMQRPEDAPKKEVRDAAAGIGTIEAPRASEFILFAKLLFFLNDFLSQAAAGGSPPPPGADPASLVAMSDQFAGWNGKNPAYPPSVSNPIHRKKDAEPAPAADRLRAAVIAAEFLDKDELGWRIRDVEQSLDASSDLRTDARIVRSIYGLEPAPPPATPAADTPANGDPPEQDADADPLIPVSPSFPKGHKPTDEELAASHQASLALSDADKTSFRERHGWFADLALSRGDKASTIRQSASSDGLLLVLFFCLVGFIVLAASLIGFVLLIVGFVRLAGGRIRWAFARPNLSTEWPPHEEAIHHPVTNPFPRRVLFATPGSVWLETVAVFFALFLGVKLAVAGLAGALNWSNDIATGALLGGQWLVALAIFWPIVRGMPFGRWKTEIGWSAPRGVLKEIGAGICGYLACLPVYFGAAIIIVTITFIVSHLFDTGDPQPAGNRLTQVLEGGAPWELVLIFTLATVWAPIVEESIFRGCLFRHFRRRFGLILAALGSAAVFAVLHGYLVQQLFMVATLGFWFALMREWRGGIIATVTAHAIHNGFVLTIVLVALSFARG